jgi:hypothetical protein
MTNRYADDYYNARNERSGLLYELSIINTDTFFILIAMSIFSFPRFFGSYQKMRNKKNRCNSRFLL